MLKITNLTKKMLKWGHIVLSGNSIKDKWILIKYVFALIANMKHPESYLDKTVTVKSINNTLFLIPSHKPYFLWQQSPQNEPEVLTKFLSISNIKSFFDIGANVGRYSIIIADKFSDAKIYAFEPEKNNFEYLKKNIEKNKLRNIFPQKIALSDKISKEKLFISPDENLGHHSFCERVGNSFQHITTSTLDTFVSKNKIEHIDLIKIDVEGAETLVLTGAQNTIKRFHPKIIFEAWDKHCLEKIRTILDSFNYRIIPLGHQDYYAY